MIMFIGVVVDMVMVNMGVSITPVHNHILGMVFIFHIASYVISVS